VASIIVQVFLASDGVLLNVKVRSTCKEWVCAVETTE